MRYQKIHKAIILCICLFSVTVSVKAIKAFPELLILKQPDGEVFLARLIGDESFHVLLTEDFYPLVQNEEKYYVYAEINEEGCFESTGVTVNTENLKGNSIRRRIKKVDEELINKLIERKRYSDNIDRKVAPGLMPTNFPTIGNHKALVVLVEFADNSFSMENPYEYFYRMLNEEGYSDNGGAGSARDYFITNSMGQFIPEFDVYGPVKLSGKIADYGSNDAYGYDANPQKMAIEACELLDEEIDFRQYDRNGDGVIDNVFFYYAGYGEHDGGGRNTIWPHSTKLSLIYKNKFLYDGVELDRYACTNELNSPQRGGLPDGIGTFCHEFSHVLGLPDLYATSFINLDTPGAWDVMDSGNYNNDGHTPANFSSFERYSLGWLEPTPIDFGEFELDEIGESNEAYIFQCLDENECFLFENRQLRRFDEFLPGHGMLVWHINYNKSAWDNNTVNNFFWQQYVDLIEADGKAGDGSRAGDPFPGIGNNTQFSVYTTPSFKGKSQTFIPYGLKSIMETNDGKIIFSVVDPATTAVNTIFEPEKNEVLYDITGRKIKKNGSERGIYILNGKKVVF